MRCNGEVYPAEEITIVNGQCFTQYELNLIQTVFEQCLLFLFVFIFYFGYAVITEPHDDHFPAYYALPPM
ncbi:ORF10 [White sturgeon adenovirus 1]|uniref:ORF10 n=1 Tax=White sturgeon adenovirus 1 TaxID=2580388 RepID=A0A4P8PIR5_9ADEN|nr:ORF10 [White sturgeon adenovirus 1]QCQ84191.1 ORF10 [White sturgeon adenovirus 1]